jgi:hypothetical protein
MELDRDTLGLAKVWFDIDVILRICGRTGKEIRRTLISHGLVAANCESKGRLLALVALNLSNRSL